MSSVRQRLDRYVARALRRARLRRSLRTAAIVLPVATTIVVLLSILTGSSALSSMTLPRALAALALASSMLLIVIVAALRPCRQRIVRELDRRLGLRGALVTAIEESASEDPVCRLLVRRTARAIGSRPRDDALPLHLGRTALVLPLLAFLVASLQFGPRSDTAFAPRAASPDTTAISGLLQSGAERIVERASPWDDEAVDAARELARIDAALRLDETTPEGARELVEKLAARHVAGARRAAGRPGPQSDPADESRGTRMRVTGRDWRQELAELGRRVAKAAPDDSPAVELGRSGGSRPPGHGNRGGAGDGRGSGRAGLEIAGSPRSDVPAEAVRSGIEWPLPAPSRWSDGPTVDAAGGAAPVAAFARDQALPSRVETSPHRPLTRTERQLVNAYFRALARRERAVHQGSPLNSPRSTASRETSQP